jgi:hypothetical protein
MPSCCWSYLPLHRTLLDWERGVVVALYVCNARRRRPLWRLDRIGSRGGDASTTTPTMFIWTFPRCDLQGYVDLISPLVVLHLIDQILAILVCHRRKFFVFYTAKPFNFKLSHSIMLLFVVSTHTKASDLRLCFDLFGNEFSRFKVNMYRFSRLSSWSRVNKNTNNASLSLGEQECWLLCKMEPLYA